MPRPRTHHYPARVERLDDGMRHHVIPVPDPVAEALLAAGHRRVVLTLAGRDYRRALQTRRELGHLIIVGQDILKECGLRLGSPIEAAVRTDPEPERVDVPEELSVVLAQDPDAEVAWESLTLGLRRSIIIYAGGAKRSGTRLKRSLEIAEKLRNGTLHGMKKPS